jgi:hypothetical protein
MRTAIATMCRGLLALLQSYWAKVDQPPHAKRLMKALNAYYDEEMK